MENSPKYTFNSTDAYKWFINIAKYFIVPTAIMFLEQVKSGQEIDYSAIKVFSVWIILDLLHRFTKWATYNVQKNSEVSVESEWSLDYDKSQLW